MLEIENKLNLLYGVEAAFFIICISVSLGIVLVTQSGETTGEGGEMGNDLQQIP